jgi:hypothetical protein
MPSKSKGQHNLMQMSAHGGKPAGMKGPPVAVAKEFASADAHRKAMVDALGKRKKPAAPPPVEPDGDEGL